MARNRNRRNRRRRKDKQRGIMPWILSGIICSLLTALIVFVPRLRSVVSSLVGMQATREFGTLLGIVPPTTGRALLCIILDNSGSTNRFLSDARGNQIPYRRRLAEEAERLSQVLVDDPTKLVDTYIWRLGALEGRIHTGVNDEIRINTVLREQFVNTSEEKKPGSNFAPALNAALTAYQDYKQDHKNAALVITIGTDGGVTDSAATREVAERLSKENVIVVVHGIIPQDRLWELTQDALTPLRKAHKLIVSNLTDFDLHLPEFRRELEKRKVVSTGGTALPAVKSVLPASGPVSAGGATSAAHVSAPVGATLRSSTGPR